MVEQEVTIQLPEIRDDEKNAKRKIAIVGAGPAGLTCAYFLARLGYRPNVFEAEQRPGGMLVQTIPAYRLPREELAREVRMIERLGVDIETGMRLGKDFTLTSLRDEGYEAVFLGVGAPQGTKLGVPGEELEGVTDAIGFLREYNIRGSARVGRKVAVVGGGNAAMDAARTAIRLGAESVTILYRRSRDEMPAYAEEIDEAEHEGVVLKVLAAPVEILGERRPRRRREVPRHGARRFRPQRPPPPDRDEQRRVRRGGRPGDRRPSARRWTRRSLSDGVDLKLTRNKFIEINPVNGQTSVPWIFAGGDAATGPSSVVEAVGSGESAAVGMDEMLTGAKHAFWRAERDVETAFDPEADPVQYPRAQMQLIPVARRRQNFSEVEQPFGPQDALREAKRCLRCDYRAKDTDASGGCM